MDQLALLADWELVRSRRKTLELRVYPGGRVQVRAPVRASRRDISHFLHSKRSWLERQLQQSEEKCGERPNPWVCCDGAAIYMLGEPLVLRLQVGRKGARQETGELILQLPANKQDRFHALLESYYRETARHYYQQCLDNWFPYFAERGYRRPVLRIKKMRTRWGSLSERGYINLNLALLQYEPALIESVVVHELCHLVYMNHGSGFKALQTKLLPDWKERKQKLEKQATALPVIF